MPTRVWFDGGRQWNCVDSYMGTRALEEFRHVLDRGGVIAGSSAGATIQGDYLVRGDTSGPDVMMTKEPDHQHGFAFLRRSAIDQHINTRCVGTISIPVVKAYPNLLGIGLSEDTGIIVTGDTFEVIGKWKVAVHDNTRVYQPWEKPYYVLSTGDVYNMKTRKVEKYGTGSPVAVGRGGGESINRGFPAGRSVIRRLPGRFWCPGRSGPAESPRAARARAVRLVLPHEGVAADSREGRRRVRRGQRIRRPRVRQHRRVEPRPEPDRADSRSVARRRLEGLVGDEPAVSRARLRAHASRPRADPDGGRHRVSIRQRWH